MLNKIAEFFWRIAGLKTFLTALLIYIAFAGGVMRTGLQQIQQISGKPVQVLDLQFSYTPEKARAIIGEYNVAPNLGIRLAPEYYATGFGSTIQGGPGFTGGIVYRFGKQ